MGVVYRARDEFLHRDVALKVVAPGDVSDQSSRGRLLHEARASSGLSHPNICTIHEVGEFNGELYIVMELVDGRTLRELIGSGGLPGETILRYGGQIAGALAHPPSRSITHPDLKNSKVLITKKRRVEVLHFGLARRTLAGISY